MTTTVELAASYELVLELLELLLELLLERLGVARSIPELTLPSRPPLLVSFCSFANAGDERNDSATTSDNERMVFAPASAVPRAG